jgi:alkaline phosphatase/alkaline phosphatase D
MKRLLTIAFVLISAQAGSRALAGLPFNALGELTGEVGPNSAILQTRLTADAELDTTGDVAGAEGWACFEIAARENFSDSWCTSWQKAVEKSDFIVKEKVHSLAPETRYFYRVLISENPAGGVIRKGNRNSFRTAPENESVRDLLFTVTTSHRHEFRESEQGFEAYRIMARLNPDFNVLTGDDVYYDADPPVARDVTGMRHHWHRVFGMPLLRKFYSFVPGYWMKDDHDYRFDDADPYMPPRKGGSPGDEEGRMVFLEQTPVPVPTHRRIRWGKVIEIWFPEGRDYRSPNAMPDGPGKTLWGIQQRRWLEETIISSDAMFKILLSPTGLVGPDRGNKRDSHANRNGFFTEGQNFLRFLKEREVNNFFIVNGDRHWKYHSVHIPTGYEEFCCGALTDGASVKDPDYKDDLADRKWHLGNGGFLAIRVLAEGVDSPELIFDFYEEDGNLVHTIKRKFQ